MARGFETEIAYYQAPNDGSSLPYNDWSPLLGNAGQVKYPCKVHDIRGREDEFTLEEQGFTILKHKSKVQDWRDRDLIRSVYFEEMADMLKERLNAHKVVVFGECRRVLPRDWWNDRESWPGKPQGPNAKAHIDVISKGAQVWLESSAPDAVPAVREGRRWAIFSAWRPYRTVSRDPLAVADARSIPREDLLAFVPAVMPDGKEVESFVVTHSEESRHQWYYLHGQEPDEVLLMKFFDSAAEEGVVSGSPHCSVVAPGTEGDPPRESIDVRAVVCW